MSANPSLPRLFGPYVLTRELSRDPLGEVYRAGSSAGKSLKPFLLIRTFSGTAIDRGALLPAMETAVEYLEEVKGPAVAKGQVLGVVDDVPFAGVEYMAGRTLDAVVGGPEPAPLPIEHALLIAEKILVSLEAAKPFTKGTGAPHGFLIPGFICVSNDGDVRVYGGGLGKGLLPCLKNAAARAAFHAYIAPEVAAGAQPSMAGDIYSTAAILLECLTGKRPAPANVDQLANATLSLNGNPLPDDIKALLARGLASDLTRRASDVSAYKKELGKLLYGGPYAPSTFNLAFFMHHQFEKAIERERKELATEELIDTRPLQAAEDAAAAPPPPAPEPRDITVPKFGLRENTSVDRTLGGTPVGKKPGLAGIPIPAVVAVVVVLGGLGIFLAMRGGKPAPPPVLPTPAPVVQPTVAPTKPPPTPFIAGKDDPDFQKAVMEQLQAEEKKMRDQMAKKQETEDKKRQVELGKAADEARKAKEAEDAARAARERADAEEATRLAREAAEARQREEAARAAAAAAIPKVREGELLEISAVDSPPQTTKIVKPEPTGMALRQHVSGTVLLKVLVDEKGRAESVEVLRDTVPKVGLGEACKKAVSQWQWTPATKDGKKVKTWIVVPIPFQKL